MTVEIIKNGQLIVRDAMSVLYMYILFGHNTDRFVQETHISGY